MNIYSTEHDSYEVSKLPIRMPKEQFIVGVIGEDMILITRTRVLVINIVNGKFHEEHLNHRIMCKS